MRTMLAFAKSPGIMLGDLAGHRFTEPEGLVQCESMLVIDTPPSAQAQARYSRNKLWWRVSMDTVSIFQTW